MVALKHISWSDYGPPNDKAQVRSVAEIFAAADHAGELAAWFAGAPNLSQRRARSSSKPRKPGPRVTAPEGAQNLSLLKNRRHSRESGNPGTNTWALAPGPPLPAGVTRGEADIANAYTYLRDPAAIYRRSFALIRAEAGLARFPPALRPLAMRLAHAAGDVGDPRRSRLVCAARSRPGRRRWRRRRRSSSTVRWSLPASSASGCRAKTR